VQRVRGRARAREGDLLLCDPDAVDVAGGAAGLGHQPRGLQRDEAAERLSSERETIRPFGQLGGSPEMTATSPIRTRARVVAVLGADVDVQALELGARLRSSSS
jgi:hypothetical protein